MNFKKMLNQILDEYVSRNNIDVKDCFLPKNKLFFFINSSKDFSWHVVEIYWKTIIGHPSYYVLNLKSSKLNSLQESYGSNFLINYTKNIYWDEIESEIKCCLINNFNLNFNTIISKKHEAKVVSWMFFSKCFAKLDKKIDSNLKNIFENKYFDNFYKFKEYEYEVDKMLLYLKKYHRVFYDYYEIYFEQELLDFYWYNSYHFLNELFFEYKIQTKVYTT